MKKIILICILFLISTYAKSQEITLFFINDFHGGFVQDKNKEIPGAARFIGYVDSLKSIEKYKNSITLSAGDNFGGSFFSNATNGKLIPHFFNMLSVKGSAVGNHEFDNGIDFFFSTYSDWGVQYVASNVKYKDKQLSKPYIIEEIGGMKVAIIGLTTSNTPRQVEKRNIEGFEFSEDYKSYVEGILADSEVKNCDLHILLTHIGTDQQGEKVIWESDSAAELTTIIGIDGIATGHSHKVVSALERGVAVVQGEINGKYLSVMRFEFDTLSSKMKLAEYSVNKISPYGVANASMNTLVNTILDDSTYRFREVLSFTHQNLTHERSNNLKHTEIGSVVAASNAYSYQDGTKRKNIVLGMHNFGGIRSNMYKGNITRLDAGEVLPFIDTLKVFKLTGLEIKRIVEKGLNNSRYGWLQLHDLDIYCSEDSGKKVVEKLCFRKENGKSVYLKDNKNYIVVAGNYIAGGGDGYVDEQGNSLFTKEKQIDFIGKTSTNPEAFFNFLKENVDNMKDFGERKRPKLITNN